LLGAPHTQRCRFIRARNVPTFIKRGNPVFGDEFWRKSGGFRALEAEKGGFSAGNRGKAKNRDVRFLVLFQH
jgi:hypothetical protein